MICLISAVFPTVLGAPVPHAANPKAERQRGMHWWYDLVDWIGGWPFEVATPEEVLRFLHARGFEITDLMTHPDRLAAIGSAAFTEGARHRGTSLIELIVKSRYL